MNYSIIPTQEFKKEAKRLVKKYPSLKNELIELNTELLLNPSLGTSLGNKTYKIRVAIKTKGKGKSGGARVITYVVTKDLKIYLLTIYDKSEYENVDNSFVKSIIAQINL